MRFKGAVENVGYVLAAIWSCGVAALFFWHFTEEFYRANRGAMDGVLIDAIERLAGR